MTGPALFCRPEAAVVNPLYGTPEEAAKSPGGEGIQDRPAGEHQAPGWGTPGEAKAKNSPQLRRRKVPWGRRNGAPEWAQMVVMSVGTVVIGLVGWGAFSVFDRPGNDSLECYMLPLADVNQILGGEADYERSEHDGWCTWSLDDSVLGEDATMTMTSRPSTLDRIDTELRERDIAASEQEVAEGQLELIPGLGDFAVWNPRSRSLDWYAQQRTYYLDLSATGSLSEAETLDKARQLAAKATANTEPALDRAGSLDD
ncbi:hypothetical protein [Kineosporia babensis]|uniref:Uncharacterized protein n=1 Tax=Kineosporia babensis TaxID=499548 RepID=A0A9X1NE78_9ACTN|nr:hypothetical protein [Kineosporia babensis]MCD5311676.1 hypothetical protein [Kineosporia babensis]